MNVYRLPEIYFAGSSLVVSERLAGLIRACGVEAKFLEARMVRAFSIPNEPWNYDHDRYTDSDMLVSNEFVLDALERNECEVPPGNWLEVIPHRAGQMHSDDLDRAVDIPLDDDKYVCDAFKDVWISDRWIEEYGLYAAGVMLLRDDIANVVWPYLVQPYMYFGRYQW